MEKYKGYISPILTVAALIFGGGVMSSKLDANTAAVKNCVTVIEFEGYKEANKQVLLNIKENLEEIKEDVGNCATKDLVMVQLTSINDKLDLLR